jgi:hypothetical protein
MPKFQWLSIKFFQSIGLFSLGLGIITAIKANNTNQQNILAQQKLDQLNKVIKEIQTTVNKMGTAHSKDNEQEMKELVEFYYDNLQNQINQLYQQNKIQDITEKIKIIAKNIYESKNYLISNIWEQVENINQWLSSITYEQNIAFTNLSGTFLIFVTILSIIGIFYGDKLLNYLNLEERYPKIAKYITLRRKFQQFYLLINILIILVVTIIMFVMNLTLFLTPFFLYHEAVVKKLILSKTMITIFYYYLFLISLFFSGYLM